MYSLRFLAPVRNLMRILSVERSPRQIAGAVALGMLIGLLPKGNLLAAALTVLMFSVRVNLGVGLTTAFLVTLVSSQLDPLTHGIGARMLNNPTIYQALSDAYQKPVFPWTSLNNTVVLGSLTLGLALFYPVYHVAESISSKSGSAWKERRDRKLRRGQDGEETHEGTDGEPVVAPRAKLIRHTAHEVAADASISAPRRTNAIADQPVTDEVAAQQAQRLASLRQAAPTPNSAAGPRRTERHERHEMPSSGQRASSNQQAGIPPREIRDFRRVDVEPQGQTAARRPQVTRGETQPTSAQPAPIPNSSTSAINHDGTQLTLEQQRQAQIDLARRSAQQSAASQSAASYSAPANASGSAPPTDTAAGTTGVPNLKLRRTVDVSPLSVRLPHAGATNELSPNDPQHELAQRELAQRELAQRELAQRQLAQRQLAQRELAQRELAQRNAAQQTPTNQPPHHLPLNSQSPNALPPNASRRNTPGATS